MAEKLLFPGQGKDEEVIIFERRHPYFFYQRLRSPVAILLFSSLISWGVSQIPDLSKGTLVLLWMIALMPGALWAAWRVALWGKNCYIVTDKRVIHIEEIPFIREKRDEAPLGMIQDVNVEMGGILTGLLHFGNVIIQTAGTLGTVRFMGIRRPREVQAGIMALVKQAGGELVRGEEERKALDEVRRIVGLPPVELRPSPPAVEGKGARGEQLLEMLRRMFFPSPVFGEGQIIWRKHRWVLVTQLVKPFLGSLVALAIWWVIVAFRGFIIWADFLLAVCLAAMGLRIAWLVIDWRNDLYIVTNDRVIDIEKVPFRYEHRREAGLDKIQDVRYLQPSFVAKTLDFGDVRLETAGEIGAFTFDSVPHPREVQIKVFERLERFRRKAEQERANEFLKWLSRYHRGMAV